MTLRKDEFWNEGNGSIVKVSQWSKEKLTYFGDQSRILGFMSMGNQEYSVHFLVVLGSRGCWRKGSLGKCCANMQSRKWISMFKTPSGE